MSGSTLKVRPLVAAAACLVLSVSINAFASTKTRAQRPGQKRKDFVMTKHARGEFGVKVIPQPPDEKASGPPIGRFLLDKQFHGDLEGTSRGQMLGVRTAVEGSAGYVAMEEVTCTLGGRRGTFVLQHTGTMQGGALQLSVTVVPDSGTGELKGIAGRMEIKIEGGKHYYDFEYTLPETK